MKNIWIDRLFILCLCALIPAIYLGCSADESIDIFSGGSDVKLESGRQLLIEHRVKDAHTFYKSEYQKTPTDGNAAVGFAVTSVLLLPYDPAVTDLVKRLGGKGAINAKRDVIYGNNGVISLLAQGTPIDDQGGFSGIRSLLGPDLPWNSEELTDANFLNNIDVEFHDIADDFVKISDAFLPIIAALDVGVSDPSFQRFELPGEVFFNDKLTLSMNRADLAFITASFRSIRAAVHFVAAYNHPYKVSDFGSQWTNIQPEDPLYKQGYESEDYIFEFLDPKLFRSIREPARLAQAGKELQLALKGLRNAMSIAIDSPRFGALAWNQADEETILKVSTFIQALEKSVNESTKLPFIQPSLSLDMSILFKDGRTLDPQIPWFVIAPDEFGGGFLVTELNEDAIEPMLNGLFSPRLEDLENSEFAEAQNFEDLFTQLFGGLNDDFNSSFGN